MTAEVVVSEWAPALVHCMMWMPRVSVRGGSVPVGEDAADSDLVTHPGASLTTAEEDTGDDTMKYVHKEKDFISLLFCADGELIQLSNVTLKLMTH